MDSNKLTGSCSDAVVDDDLHVTQVIKIVPVTRDTDDAFTNVDMNEHIGPCSSEMDTDSSYVTQVIKMLPTNIAASGSCTAVYDSQDWFVDGLQEIKEEPKDVCHCLCMYTVSIQNELV